MNAKIEIAPAPLAKARHLYEHTLTPVADIAAMLGMSRTPFYRFVREGGWTPRRVRFAAGEFARVVVDGTLSLGELARSDATTASPLAAPSSPEPPSDHGAVSEPVDRVTLAARLMKAVERHIVAFERVQDMIGPDSPVDVERSARTLAVMGRTMREISILLRPPQSETADVSDDDSVPIDADEFRRELAQKLESLLDAERRRASEDHCRTDSEGD